MSSLIQRKSGDKCEGAEDDNHERNEQEQAERWAGEEEDEEEEEEVDDQSDDDDRKERPTSIGPARPTADPLRTVAPAT